LKSLKLGKIYENSREFINIPFVRFGSEDARLIRAWQASDDFVIRFGKRLNRDFEPLKMGSSKTLLGQGRDWVVFDNGVVFILPNWRFARYFCPAKESLTC